MTGAVLAVSSAGTPRAGTARSHPLNAAEAAFLSVDEREDLAEILVAGWGEVISGDAVGPVLEELDDEDEDD